ncbi:MAG TPA: monofunctional biosynthetic peptidoglycan transglycosylase [Micropepsaceae bacterium]|jgi:monofunctional biosynthetic peptidoglycan transglycosylase|nr:monofunctional biosynthetic peptidoglycan transglycosylase [Micropepsaceae bacterium]
MARTPKSKRTPWLRRILLLVLGVTVILPVGLILLFRFVPPPMTPLMLRVRLSEGPIAKHWVPLESISPNLVRAVIASEDGKFCSHYGFDLDAIDKALTHNESAATLRGASTISQQTAKNLFLTPDRTWTRKGIEAYLTVLIEAMWPKRRIMETYLNIAEWGPRRFGAEAAAEANFKKSAAKLSVLEAARLATILPNPRAYRADVPGPYVARQSAVIAARIAQVSRDRLDACIYR